MSTTIDNASGMTFQGTAPDDQVTTVEEAERGEAANGDAAPEGTTPVVVEPGDTISAIMAQYGLDWTDQAQREQFLAANPQFGETGERNPDLIWPGEVLYIPGASGDQQQPPGDGAVPVNGTVPTGEVDADGQPMFQNYSNGQPSGPPYSSPPTTTGLPANSDTIDANGNVIRTDENGEPLNGWGPTQPGANGSNGEEIEYTYYVDGRATTHTETTDGGLPTEAPSPVETDFAGNPIDGDGWYVVNGSSSGAQWAYFQGGHEVAGTRTTDSKSVDDPAPVVGPQPPQNGTVATTPPNESGYAQFQNYQDGEPVGPPYMAQMGANGQPVNSDTIDPDGNVIRTGADGEPLTGWGPTTPGANGSDGSEIEYSYYEDGVPTGVTRTTDQGRPTGEPTPSELTDAAANNLNTANQHLNNAADSSNPDIDIYQQQVDEASEAFDEAVMEEIDATQELPPNANREDHANAVLAAGEEIAQRLEAEGLQAEADRVRELARERADEINNEV